ncbi:hypothetical protein [Absiella sp. AM29-15]|uniref:hypothetical protein n=1 Tax=Absiella sp. AM29-15 TaxID=2292278 RepID=UPI0018F2784A|nr:hypothetical protein [Absiella sp. AM29-15]
MIYGAINEKGERYYTRMSKVFEAIHQKQCAYNWLISDVDHVPSKIEALYDQKHYCWISGDELTKIVQEDDWQWDWAVLSGFDKSIPLSEVLKYPHPYADGYRGFWKNPVSIQHPLACIEIVCWDSCLTLFISDQQALVENFKAYFPLSEDLVKYNQR